MDKEALEHDRILTPQVTIDGAEHAEFIRHMLSGSLGIPRREWSLVARHDYEK